MRTLGLQHSQSKPKSTCLHYSHQMASDQGVADTLGTFRLAVCPHYGRLCQHAIILPVSIRAPSQKDRFIEELDSNLIRNHETQNVSWKGF